MVNLTSDVILLIDKPANAPIAWLSGREFDLPTQVSVETFIRHVSAVANALPDAKFAINLCDNRYAFMVSLCAVIVRQQTNLLPANKNPETQNNLADRYANSYIIHDGELALSERLCAINIHSIKWSVETQSNAVPRVSLNHLAAISFTSGSTGESKPNFKTWRTLRDSSLINSRYMLPNQETIFYHLATVPGQHMWGLETSVLMPLFSNACLVDARPLYPQDIIDLLKRIPRPNCLITTPLHLRALVKVNSDERTLPKLDNVLVATAPLAKELAKEVEYKFAASLREVYGCSEVGSMAMRRTALSDVWTQFVGLNFVYDATGQVNVSADHLPESVALEDKLKRVNQYSFRLQGRVSDQIKIAGKRGSLLEVNTVLMKYPEVADGVVFFPEQDRAVPRLAAIVVLNKMSANNKRDKDRLRAHFRQYLDSAFVPRPILLVDSLPREDNGKLLKSKLTELYTSLLNQKPVDKSQ